MNEWLRILENNDYIGAKELIKSGGNLHATNEQEESILFIAIKRNCDNELIELLVEAGADLEYRDSEGVSVFDYAIQYGNQKLVDDFLEKDIDVNTTTRRSSMTPLMVAVCYNQFEITKKLLEKGAQIDSKDSSGISAYDFARKMRREKMMALLDEYLPKRATQS